MFRSVGIHLTQYDLSSKTRSKMLRNPTLSLDELKKVSSQLLKETLESQSILIRRLGVKVSELSDIEGQSDITSYFWTDDSFFFIRFVSIAVTTSKKTNNQGKNIISPAIEWYSSNSTGFVETFNANTDNEKILIRLIMIVPIIPIPKYNAFLLRWIFIFNKNAIITRE